MTRLICSIRNSKRKLRLILENKKTAGILLIVAMSITLLGVRLLKPIWESGETEAPDPLMGKLLEGKRAVSLVVKTSNLPLDLLYPGAMVDVTDIRNGEVLYLARDVAIAGLSIIEEGVAAKVTLAVDQPDSENLIKNRTETVSLILSDNKHTSNDIEIVEM